MTRIWNIFKKSQNCVRSKHNRGFPGGSEVKVSACNAGDPGSIPGLGRSPGEGNSNPLQYSCLENLVDRGGWQAAVHGVTKSQTWLNDFTSPSLQTLKINERFASHHKMGYHCLSHNHEKCLTSFIIGEMQNRTAVCMIFLEKWKWQKKIPNEF